MRSASPALPSHDGPEALPSATSRPDYDCSIRLSPDGVAAARTAREMSCFSRWPSARALQGFAGHSKIAAALRYPDPEVLLMRPRVAVVAAALSSRRRSAGEPLPRADAVRPVLRQEQHPLRQLRVAHLHDRPLRDLLLPGARAAPRAHRRLRGERVSADQRRPEARPAVQGAADPVQDAQRVRAAERHSRRGAGRRRRVRRAVPPAHGAADRRAAGPALRPDRPRADAPVRVRHHPAVADPPERAAVGQRRAVRLRARRSGRRST